MTTTRFRFAALVLLTPLAAPAWLRSQEVPRPGTREATLAHGGYQRRYLLHVPARYDPARPTPLVLVLHGQGGNGARLTARGGWVAKADREGFLVVAPDATGPSPAWNSGYNNGRDYPVDDVAFLRALLDDLGRRLNVDRKRVFACGLSSGAMMSYRVAAEMPERFAAIAPVAGSIGAMLKDRGGAVVTIPEPKGPVSVLAIHGRADTNVPYGGSTNRVMNFLPVADSIAFWVRRDGCDPKPTRSALGDGNVVRDDYPRGKDGTEVVLYTIGDGGHTWPHQDGPGGHSIDATEVIWDFFARHPKGEPAPSRAGASKPAGAAPSPPRPGPPVGVRTSPR